MNRTELVKNQTRREDLVVNLFSLRGVYDEVEKRLSPVLEGAVHSDDLANALKVIGRVRGAVGGKLDGLNASVLHLVNLPAGSDIRKLRMQVGQLDYEVRRLRMELADRDAEGGDRDGADS